MQKIIKEFRDFAKYLKVSSTVIPDIEIQIVENYIKKNKSNSLKEFFSNQLKSNKSCPDFCVGDLLDNAGDFICDKICKNIDVQLKPVYSKIAIYGPISKDNIKKYFYLREYSFDWEFCQEDVEPAIELLVECGLIKIENYLYDIV